MGSTSSALQRFRRWVGLVWLEARSRSKAHLKPVVLVEVALILATYVGSIAVGAERPLWNAAVAFVGLAILTVAAFLVVFLLSPFWTYERLDQQLRAITGDGGAYLAAGPMVFGGSLRPVQPAPIARPEFHYRIQNAGGSPATFTAQMSPVRGGRQVWYVPWVESNTHEARIGPILHGTLLAFRFDEGPDSNWIKSPVEIKGGTIQSRVLDDDGHGEKTAFRLTITSDPPMPKPHVVYFAFVPGGIRVVTYEEAHGLPFA